MKPRSTPGAEWLDLWDKYGCSEYGVFNGFHSYYIYSLLSMVGHLVKLVILALLMVLKLPLQRDELCIPN